MPKVSIIIPVYNTEKYLIKCLTSIQNQTLTDLEIVCINDGSTDSSLKILKDFAQNDNRFIIIDKKNEGQGVARNCGIERASGEFLIFVDSDDWLENNALELCYNKIKQDNTDILFFNNYNYREEKNKKDANDYTAVFKQFKEKPFTKEDVSEKIFFCNALAFKMYKTEFIKNNKIKFSAHKFMEDMVFFYKAVFLSSSLSCLNDYIYNYRIHNTSSTFNLDEQLKCMPEIYNICFAFLQEHKIEPKLINAFIESRQNSLLYFYKLTPLFQKAKYYKMMKNIIKTYLTKYNLNEDCRYILKSNYLQFYFYLNIKYTKIVLQSYFI